jgi:ubiquinone/menaquinone biosynthesis C-methylase UbiE
MMPYFPDYSTEGISWFKPQLASTVPVKLATFASTDGAIAGAMQQEFCDRFPRFLETTETVPSRSRLNARWRAMIGWNAAVLAGRRVLDLGCHDGRWSFAALDAGARHVVGVEVREHLVKKAAENFSHYGVPTGSYDFVTGDAMETLRALKPASIDVVMCLGFFYHTMEHMRLLLEARRLGAEYIIIDTSISAAKEPIVALFLESTEDTRRAVDYGLTGSKEALVGVPSRSGLLAMLDYAGYQAVFFDWQNNAVGDWTDLPDYAAHVRVTVRAQRQKTAPQAI